MALIDLNLLCGDVTSFLDLTPRYTLGNVISHTARVDANFLMSVMARHTTGVDVLCAPVDVEDSRRITPEQIQEVLAVTKSLYSTQSWIPAASFSAATSAAFGASDHILFTTVLTLPAIRNAKRYISAIDSQRFQAGRAKLVITGHLPRTISKQAMRKRS